MPTLAQTRESTEAELARLEQLRATARKLMKIVVAVPGPGTVAVYLLHAVARPVWQFQVLLATAVLMAAALAVAAVLVHRDRFEQGAAVAFAGVTLQCVAPLALRADAFAIAVLGQIGAIMLVWFLAPHRLLRTGIVGVVAIVALRTALAFDLLPVAEPPPLVATVFDVGMAAMLLPVVMVALEIGRRLNELPFRHLEASAAGRLRALGALRRVQPELAALAEQVSRSAEVVATGAGRQATTADEVARATAQLEHLLVETSTAAMQARATAEAIRKNAQESGERLDAVQARLHAFLPALRGVAGTVRTLADRSHGTDRVIEAVDEVHDSVKVLALNASIEAMRAGEAGRGIAVVASEMRSMIAGTEASVQEGRGLLAAVKTEAAATVRQVEQAAADLERHLADLSHARDLIAGVMQSFTEAAQSIETIAVAGQDQRHQVEVVSRAMQGLHGSADELTRSASELVEGTERFMRTQGDVAKLVNEDRGTASLDAARPGDAGARDGRGSPGRVEDAA